MTTLTQALHALRSHDPMTGAQHQELDARIRRAIATQFGSFSVPDRAAVHTTRGEGRGMLVLLPEQVLRGRIWTGLRPALVVASVAAFAIGAAVAVVSNWSGGGVTTPKPNVPANPGIAIAPIIRELTPGSGTVVSVFSVATFSAGSPTPGRSRIVTPAFRRIPRPVTPAAGVFTTWGSGVFSEQEILRNRAREVGVFSGDS